MPVIGIIIQGMVLKGRNEVEEGLVSVVIPVYNVYRYVSQCLESVARQSYKNIEVIVIDDGSTDGSSSICDQFSKIDNRFFVLHTQNNGLASARNMGIQKARGRYLFFVDSDDWVEPHALETLMSAALQTDADIVIGRYYIEYVGRSICSSTNEREVYCGHDVIDVLGNRIVGDTVWNKLYRYSCFDNLRFPEGHNFEDVYMMWKLMHELADNNGRITILPETLYHFRMRKSSISHSKTLKNIADMWTAYHEKYKGLYECNENLIRDCIWSIGSMWLHYSGFSKEEKTNAYGLIREMRCFSRMHFRQIMTGKYQRIVKASCLLSQWLSTMWFCFYCGKIWSAINNGKQVLFE